MGISPQLSAENIENHQEFVMDYQIPAKFHRELNLGVKITFYYLISLLENSSMYFCGISLNTSYSIKYCCLHKSPEDIILRSFQNAP